MATCTHKDIDADGDDLHVVPCDCGNDFCDAKLVTCVGKCCDACKARERGRCGTCNYDFCKPCFVRHLAECSSHTCASCSKNPCEKTARMDDPNADLRCEGCGREVSAFKIAECNCHTLQYCYPCFNAHQQVMDKCECNGCGKNPCTCMNNDDRDHHGMKRKADDDDDDDVDAKHKDANPRATKRAKVEGQHSPTARLESLVVAAAAASDFWRPAECIRCDKQLDVGAPLVQNKYCSITCATDDPEATDDDDDRRAKQDTSTTTVSLTTVGMKPPEPGRLPRMRECRLALPANMQPIWSILDEYLETCLAVPPTYVATVEDKYKHHGAHDLSSSNKYKWTYSHANRWQCPGVYHVEIHKHEDQVPLFTTPMPNGSSWNIHDVAEYKGVIFVVICSSYAIGDKKQLMVNVHAQDGALLYCIDKMYFQHDDGPRFVSAQHFKSYIAIYESGDVCTIRVYCWSSYFEHRFE